MTLAPMPAARASARIDTLALRVELPGALHSATLHDDLAAEIGSTITVKPDNGIGRFKTIRVQDMTPARLALLIERFGQTGEIERLDVAIDWRLARRPGRTDNETSQALDDMTAGLTRSFAPPAEDLAGDGRPRQADRETGQVHVLARKGDWPHRIAPAGGTTYFGSRQAGMCWRIYRKTVNEGQPVPLSQQHTRVELEISGAGLARVGLSRLSDLAGFGFDGLARLFKFADPTLPPRIDSPLGRIVHTRLLRYRRRAADAGAWSLDNWKLVANKSLNDAAQRSLRRLATEYARVNISRTLAKKEVRHSAASEGSRYSCQSNNTSSPLPNTHADPQDDHQARPIGLTGSPCSPVIDHQAEEEDDGLAMLAPVKSRCSAG